MRPRTFILLLVVLFVAAIVVVLVIVSQSGGGLFGGGDGNGNGNGSTAEQSSPDSQSPDTTQQEGGPIATPLPPTPSLRLESVVIARSDLPVGTRLTADLVMTEDRPSTNVALQGGYVFNDVEEVLGQIIKVDIQRGDAILRPMIAVDAADLATFGSDVALYVDRGQVAVAFPIDQYSGAAFAMRPGDFVDILMTARVIEIDPDFRTMLPNNTERVIESDLLEGFFFFFDQTTQGRLEFIPEINQVVEIVPGSSEGAGQEGISGGEPIPKRVTQLTIQQAEVLWAGTWQDPRELERAHDAAMAQAMADPENPRPTPTPLPDRYERKPDVVILSMPAQDAVALKWALERGVDIDLALRAQGDETLFVTSSVSLFQIVEQGGVAVPPPVDFDLFPRPEVIDPPQIPDLPPELGGEVEEEEG